MLTSYSIFSVSMFALIFSWSTFTHEAHRAIVPLPPDTSLVHEEQKNSEEIGIVHDTPVEIPLARAMPIGLEVPSIALSSPIEGLGTNEKGEMDVPDGSTRTVGWYQYGTSPGELGSAVLDAHVYAAFKNLHRLRVGDDIYVDMSDGKRQHFIASETATYALEDVPREALFNRNDAERLNLITCAGEWDAARDTYDHRLIVYAKLVDTP